MNRIDPEDINEAIKKAGQSLQPPETVPEKTVIMPEEYKKLLRTVGIVLDTTLLVSFLYYIFTGKRPPRGLLIPAAVTIGFRLAKNLKLIPKEIIEQQAELGM